MAERLGFNVVPLRTEWGKSMDPQVLAEALKKYPETQLVVGIHAETSSGTIQPIAEFARLAHESGALFMTDVVTSLAGCELKFDEWELDFAYSGSQKCLAAPPGISPVAISDLALEYIRNRPKPPTSWYLDLSLIADYWGPDHIAHHTAPVSMIYGLREAVGMALNETLDVRWKRHEANAAALRAGLIALGLELPISKEERLDQLTIVKLPEGIDDVKLRTQLLKEYSIEVGRGLGKFAGQVIRIGLMGESCVPANVFALLNALEKILPDHGYEVAKGVAAAAASAQLADNPSPVYTS